LDTYFIPFEIDSRVTDSRKRGNHRISEIPKNILGLSDVCNPFAVSDILSVRNPLKVDER
jgi:hypothetical protein